VQQLRPDRHGHGPCSALSAFAVWTTKIDAAAARKSAGATLLALGVSSGRVFS